ncbi:MAG: M23 family metallopeptidase [Faecalibacterium sp.]
MKQEKDSWHLRKMIFESKERTLKQHRRQFHPILKVQAIVCLAMLALVLVCRSFYPAHYLLFQERYWALFEGADYTQSFVRFAQQAVEAFAIPVQAIDAPVGSSLVQYVAEENMMLPVENYYISSGYGWRDDPFTGTTSFHSGIDFACVEGEAVYAVLDGVVERNYLSDSYGNCICIRHADGSVSLYAHLQYAFVRTGETVVAGAKIGTVGQTGAATGAHLHFEIIVNNEKQDPSDALFL